MNSSELLQQLDQLRRLPHETEWVEFKEARNQYDFNKLGKYFSALSNEANLKNKTCGWLVFGVVDKDRSICGSHFRENYADLNNLKHEVATQTDSNLTFLDIHVVNHPDGRVVMLQIPPAPQGMPIALKGHWYGRDGESIVPLNLQELETIRSQTITDDWSAGICAEASLDDLSQQAITIARVNFHTKNKNKWVYPGFRTLKLIIFSTSYCDGGRFGFHASTRMALYSSSEARGGIGTGPALADTEGCMICCTSMPWNLYTSNPRSNLKYEDIRHLSLLETRI